MEHVKHEPLQPKPVQAPSIWIISDATLCACMGGGANMSRCSPSRSRPPVSGSSATPPYINDRQLGRYCVRSDRIYTLAATLPCPLYPHEARYAGCQAAHKGHGIRETGTGI